MIRNKYKGLYGKIRKKKILRKIKEKLGNVILWR